MQFNRIAPYYDALKYLVFGNRLHYESIRWFKYISPNAQVLMVGGGSGKTLAHLLTTHPACHIHYVDASVKMVSRAKKRLTPQQQKQVHFVAMPLQQVSLTTYDVIITSYLFDLFDSSEINAMIGYMLPALKPGTGRWIDTDFRLTTSWYFNLLLKTMYWFFKKTAGVKTGKLVDTQPIFNQFGLHTTKHTKGAFFNSWLLERQQVHLISEAFLSR